MMVTKNECLMVIYILKILRREPNTWLSSVWWEPRKIFISYSPSCQWYPLYFLWSWPEKLGKVAATSSLLSSFPILFLGWVKIPWFWLLKHGFQLCCMFRFKCEDRWIWICISCSMSLFRYINNSDTIRIYKLCGNCHLNCSADIKLQY